MRLIKPEVQVEEYDGKQIMKNIERAMRTCYRSEAHTSEDSYKRLLKMAIDSGHESVLEHEKITTRMLCSIGAYKDLTRHRTGTAFSIESTRWCNYSKDKFDNQLKFMYPDYIAEDEELMKWWKHHMKNCERTYMVMAKAGATPDQLRTVLPQSTGAEMTMTCNIREWRHIFKERTNKRVNPEIRQLMIPLLLKFKEEMPELFEDIEYDKDFPEKWYAKVEPMEMPDERPLQEWERI